MMKTLLKSALIALMLYVVIVSTQVSAQASISIDHVDSLYNGKIQPNLPVKFNLRWANNSGTNLCLTSGYKIYLSNNGELPSGIFQPPVFEPSDVDLQSMFDLIFAINYFTDGFGSDTIGIGGVLLSGTGYPDGMDTVIGGITTSVSAAFAGDSLCIDSTFYGTAGPWKWALGNVTVIPDWGGPYCYEILPSCCIGYRGNFNNSPDDQVDISDFWGLISYVFLVGEAPTCYAEADLDASGFVDVSDVIRYIKFMHIPIVFPEDCE